MDAATKQGLREMTAIRKASIRDAHRLDSFIDKTEDEVNFIRDIELAYLAGAHKMGRHIEKVRAQ